MTIETIKKFARRLRWIVAMISLDLYADTVTEMRWMSLTMRDQPLSVEEAQNITTGARTLESYMDEWILTDEFRNRMRRFFNDQFGSGQDIDTVRDQYFLGKQNDIYYLKDKGACTEDAAVTVNDAWWLSEGETIRVCANIVKSALVITDNGQFIDCYDTGPEGLGREECGCGPNLIICYPEEFDRSETEYRPHILYNHMRYEFQERGLYVFEQQGSWMDLFGGDFFYGSRILYKHYLDQQALIRGYLPSRVDIARLTFLPINGYDRAEWPSTGTVTRAGLVTSPVFLRQYNNFRSRINILTARLLCQDVDSTLNTDNIAVFVNDSFDDFNKVHGTKEECSGCHYALDNLGSPLMHWNEGGWYEFWGTEGAQNELGHAFGQQVNGPAELMTGYIERAQPFHGCMAKLVWEDFSGGVWEDLGADAQLSFAEASRQGPNHLVRTVLFSDQIRLLHRRGISGVTVGGASNLSFSGDVNPILEAHCSGSACHSQGTSLGAQFEFINNEAVFAATNASRIDDGSMPPANATVPAISDSDRTLLRTWRDAQ